MVLSVSQIQTRNKNKFHYAMIMAVAFAQGSMDLCSLSYFYIYFYDLGSPPSVLSLIQGFATLPWCIKPLFGYVSDHIQFFGYKKKSYLFVVSVVEFLSHLMMFHYRFGVFGVLFINVIQVGCLVFRNVVTEAIIVILTRKMMEETNTEREKQKIAQYHVSLFSAMKALGSILASWYSTYLMEFYGNRGVFLFAAVCPLLIMSIAAFLFDETPDDTDTWIIAQISIFKEIKRIKKVLTHEEVKYFLIAAFLFTITPSLTSTYNFYYTVELKFDLATMSSISFVAAIGYFISIFVLNFVLTEYDFKCFYISTGLIIMILNCSSLFLLFKFINTVNISNVFFCYSMNALLVFANELNFIPLLGLCVRLCPKDLEGTTYGLFTSIFNFGYYLATVMASLLLLVFGVTSNNYSNLWVIVIIQCVYGGFTLVYMIGILFPRPDKVYGIDQSVYLGDFDENVILSPQKRPVGGSLSPSLFGRDGGGFVKTPKATVLEIPERTPEVMKRTKSDIVEDYSGQDSNKL